MIQIKPNPIKIHKKIIQTRQFPKLIALILGLFLLTPNITWGSFQSVEINEINYIGYTDWKDNIPGSGDEFIELKNPNPSTPIILDGWTLRILSGSGDRTITLSGTITDYIVIRRITSAQSSLPPIDKVINITSTNFGSLNNTTGAYIELRDHKGITIDAVNFRDKWPATTNNTQSLHKVSNLVWEVKPHSPLNIIDSTPSPTPAPNPEPEIIPEPEKNSYGGVIISEIYPNPIDGGKEFVELYNTTDKDIDLQNWKLDDIPNGGSSIQSLSGIIPARGFLLLESGSGLKIILNNDQDSVILYDPDGNIQSQVDYTMKASQKGYSYMYVDNIWIWNASPSPNAINVAPLSAPVETTPIEPSPVIPIIPQLPRYSIGSVIISEIYPNPIDGGKEFVELYNTTDKDIDLNNWKLDDIPNGGSNIQNLVGIILAKSVILLEKGLGLSIILNNDQDSVLLYDPEGNIQSQVDYTMKTSQKGYSYMFFNNNWFWSSVPSPNLVNIAPVLWNENKLNEDTQKSPRYNIGSVIISEIYPYPSIGEEFIELYNNTEQAIDITGWKIADLAKSFTLSGTIPAKGYKTYNQSETKIALNNTKETVTLTDNYNQIQSTTSYTKAYKGLSYIPILQGWGWTQTITPNAPNIFTEKDNKDSSKNYIGIKNIEQLSQIEDGEYVEIEGQVMIPVGTLIDNSFYIIKDNRVVKIYDRQKRFPTLKEGDIVKIQAEWHNTNTQQYLKTNSINNTQIITEQKIDIKVENITKIENSDWGKIVNITGVLDTNTKTKLVINNKNQNTTVKLYSNKITKPKMKKGDLVKLTGFTEVYDGEIRVIPWKVSQIKVIPAIKKSNTNSTQINKVVLDNNPSNLISNTTTKYRGLDEYQILGANPKSNNTAWYNKIWETILNYKYLSTAIALNLIWWGYLGVLRYKKLLQ
jgi:DNA/RNA endonuclease YhcR with UshA esterase domain